MIFKEDGLRPNPRVVKTKCEVSGHLWRITSQIHFAYWISPTITIDSKKAYHSLPLISNISLKLMFTIQDPIP